MLNVESSSCLISRGSISAPRRSILSLLLLRKLEPDVRAGAQPHQPQQGRTELRHAEAIVNRGDENDPEHNRPREDLEAMKAVTAAVGENVAQESLRHRRRTLSSQRV